MFTAVRALLQVMSQEQALSFPTRNAAFPTATNQSLVIDQLDVMSNWPNIEHNEMQQKVSTMKFVFLYAPHYLGQKIFFFFFFSAVLALPKNQFNKMLK